MSMNSVHIFDNKAHYTNASATDSSGTSFVLTSLPDPDRKLVADVTTIKGPNGKQTSIYWGDGAFDIDGQILSIDTLRSKDRRPGISLSVRRWSYKSTSWHIKYEYKVKTWHVWRLVNDTAEEKTTMEFKPYKSKLIGHSEPATIVMDTSLSESEALFLWMAVIYCEVTEHPETSFLASAGDNIARAITAGLMTLH